VYPGTHHVLAKHLRDKGPNWMYDGKKRKTNTNEEVAQAESAEHF